MRRAQAMTLFCCAVLCAAALSVKAATVTVDPGTTWSGFMNVFNTPQNGGAFVFNSGWGTPDLTANFAGSVLTLGPNTVGDPDPFWYTPAGGPGSVGNKSMDASFYNETNGVYTGQTLTFTGKVLSNTLFGHTNQLGNGWTSVAFIKDFAPDYSSNVSVTVPLNAGVFSISLPTINDPARHIQYGFETIGPNVWATDVAPYGNIQITAVPEPAIMTLAGLAAMCFNTIRRRR